MIANKKEFYVPWFFLAILLSSVNLAGQEKGTLVLKVIPPIGKTIENDEMIIGPIIISTNKNTLTLGNRYLIYSARPESTHILKSLDFDEREGVYFGMVFVWALNYVDAFITKPFSLSSFYIIPIPNGDIDSYNAIRAKSVSNAVLSEFEYEGRRCKQMQTSHIFDEKSIIRELDNFIADVDADKLSNQYDNMIFSQLREDRHAYKVQEIDIKRFDKLEKLSFIHPKWKITHSNILKVHAGLLAILTYDNYDEYEDFIMISFVHCNIIQGGSSTHFIEQLILVANDFKDICHNYYYLFCEGELYKDMFMPLKHHGEIIDTITSVTDIIHSELCNMFEFDEIRNPTFKQKYELLYFILNHIIYNEKFDSRVDPMSISWFIKKCGDFFDKYSWWSVGNKLTNEQCANSSRNDIECSDNSIIRIIKTLANNSLIYGYDLIFNTYHYVYAGYYDDKLSWIKIPESYIPIDIFIKTYEKNEDYFSLIDRVREKIDTDNYYDQLKNNQIFLSIKVNIDDQFILKSSEPPAKSQFLSAERTCLIDSTMIAVDCIGKHADVADIKNFSSGGCLKHLSGQPVFNIMNLKLDKLSE